MGGSTGSVVVCVSGAVWCFLLRRGGFVRWECADESVTATSHHFRFGFLALPFLLIRFSAPVLRLAVSCIHVSMGCLAGMNSTVLDCSGTTARSIARRVQFLASSGHVRFC